MSIQLSPFAVLADIYANEYSYDADYNCGNNYGDGVDYDYGDGTDYGYYNDYGNDTDYYDSTDYDYVPVYDYDTNYEYDTDYGDGTEYGSNCDYRTPNRYGFGYDYEYVSCVLEWEEYLRERGIDLDNIPFVDTYGNTVDLSSLEYSLGRSFIIRYNILVIDVSGSMAGEPIVAARIAAQRFVDAALTANGINYVAIVAFGQTATLRAGFTNDPVVLRNAIIGLHASGGTAMNEGLLVAEQLINSIPYRRNPNVITNVLLFSDGLPNVGATSIFGPFQHPQPSWQHANAVYHTARRIMSDGNNMYSLGFFHGMTGGNLHFAANEFKPRLQNRGYFIVNDPRVLDFVFDDIIGEMFGVPIIVIPGIMGSSLGENGEIVWMHWAEFPIGGFSRIPRLALNTSGASVNRIYPRMGVYGVNEGLSAIGPLPGTSREQVLPYANLMQELRAEFGDGMVHFFAYDWRLNNAYTARLLRDFIDGAMRSSNASRVDIIAHSMGGLVAAYYIANGYGDNVQQLITLGTPFLGSSQTPYIFATGRMIAMPWGHLQPTNIRRISSHMMSAYQLLPYRAPVQYIAIQTTTGRWPRQEQHIEPVIDTHAFIRNTLQMVDVNNNRVPAARIGNFLNSATDFQSSLILPNNRHVIQTVNHHVIYGSSNSTIRSTIFDPDGSYVRHLTFEIGDGTVPVWSATFNYHISRENLHRVSYNHTSMVYQASVINHIIGVLHGLPREESGFRPSVGRVVIRVASPVDVTIIRDGETLSSAANSIISRTSFGSLYFIGPNEEIALFALNADYIYNVLIVGTGYGTMDYSISFYDDCGNLLEERAFIDIPIIQDTTITTNTDQNQATTLVKMVDGEYSRVLFPSVNVPNHGVKYSLTILAEYGGFVALGENGSFAEGSTIDIAAEADYGFVFAYWAVSTYGVISDALNQVATLMMPDSPVIITANFERIDEGGSQNDSDYSQDDTDSSQNDASGAQNDTDSSQSDAAVTRVDADGYTLIRTAAELNAIRRNLNGRFRLHNDIDLSGFANWQPINGFTGTLDGNGFAVSGLRINRPNMSNVGLFGTIIGATIRNLTVELGGDILGLTRVGVIVGSSSHLTNPCGESILENNMVVGNGYSVRAAAFFGHAGGIIGYSGDNTRLTGNSFSDIRVIPNPMGRFAVSITGVFRVHFLQVLGR